MVVGIKLFCTKWQVLLYFARTTEKGKQMNAGARTRTIGYFIALGTLVFGFWLFYTDTQEPVGSLVAAALSACLVLATFLGLSWLVQVFTK